MTHTPDRMEIEKMEPSEHYLYVRSIAKIDRNVIELTDKLNEVIDSINHLHRRLDEYENT